MGSLPAPLKGLQALWPVYGRSMAGLWPVYGRLELWHSRALQKHPCPRVAPGGSGLAAGQRGKPGSRGILRTGERGLSRGKVRSRRHEVEGVWLGSKTVRCSGEALTADSGNDPGHISDSGFRRWWM